MSAIGDYIHYNSSNYRLWGITRPKEYNTPSYYSGSIANYIINKRNLKASTTIFNYSTLEKNIKANSLVNVIRDQQLVNLDYGRKINQFRGMIVARIEKRNESYKGKISKDSEETIMGYKKIYDSLQHNITVINNRISKGKTVPKEWLEKVSLQYQKIQNLNGRITALGGIQQGLNDNAARVWERKLKGSLGKKIDEYTKESAKIFLHQQLKENLVSSKNMIIQTDIPSKNQTVYETSDSTGSTYSLIATNEGWEIKTVQNRKNILKGTLKNIYIEDPGLKSFSLNGDIPLMTVLQLLENEDRFSTHWLNRHSNQLDSSLDSGLKTAIIYEAITKGRNQTSLSEDFVYIDRTKGTIKRASFWSIIEMGKFNISPNLTNHQFNNEWAAPEQPSYKGSIARINNLLKQVHAMNMVVASQPISLK